MERVTMSQLEAVVLRINELTKSPIKSYTSINNKLKANIGNYHLNCVYGGWTLHRMSNTSGGVQDVFNQGFISKRELLNLMHAYIAGLTKVL